MKKVTFILCILVAFIFGSCKNQNQQQKKSLRSITLTTQKDKLSVDIYLKDSVYTISFRPKKSNNEYFFVAFQYGKNGSEKFIPKIKKEISEVEIGAYAPLNWGIPDKDITVTIYTKDILLGEIKFLNPKNGIFEKIIFLLTTPDGKNQ